jgi:pimeloyl-ACP methyl ester carboxylesterase
MRQIFRFRFLIIPVTASLLSMVVFLAVSSPTLGDDTTRCTKYRVPVTISSSDPTIYHIVGSLCAQGSRQGKTLQLLLHGNIYDHNYWDWPLDPQKYSYVRKVSDEGYASFNIDRLGYGQSDHPLSTLVTLESDAFVIHQLVQDLNNGVIGNTHFSKVILVGHSYGSLIALFEQAIYADTNTTGLLLSGFVHQLGPGFSVAAKDLYPALQDPKFVNANLPGLYLTTVPGTRSAVFYNTANASPAVISLDEKLKQTATDGELATGANALAPTISQSIHVPVLIAVGQDDLLYCSPSNNLSCANRQAILQRETANFSSQACLEAFVLPNAGHSLNLHSNAHSWFGEAVDWANEMIGNSTDRSKVHKCQELPKN